MNLIKCISRYICYKCIRVWIVVNYVIALRQTRGQQLINLYFVKCPHSKLYSRSWCVHDNMYRHLSMLIYCTVLRKQPKNKNKQVSNTRAVFETVFTVVIKPFQNGGYVCVFTYKNKSITFNPTCTAVYMCNYACHMYSTPFQEVIVYTCTHKTWELRYTPGVTHYGCARCTFPISTTF